MKKKILGILLSFALMLTMMPVLGLSQTAYADVDVIHVGSIFPNDYVINFGSDGVYMRADYSVAQYTGSWFLHYSDYRDSQHIFELQSDEGGSRYLRFPDEVSNVPWGVAVTGGNGTSSKPFILTVLHQAPVSYNCWVGGRQVTSVNASNILGDNTASYDAESNTLTLNGATITTGHKDDNYNCESGIYYNGSELLNIVLADDSENTVEIAGGTCSSQIGICVDASSETLPRLNISGKGQLTVSGSNYGIHAPIITIDGCDVTASGGSGIHSYRGSIEIKGGSVYASATNYAIDAASDTVSFDVIINAGSKVTASGGNKAIFGKVKNAIAGIGWTDTAGTTGEANIAVGEHTRTELANFKKVQFPVMFTVTFTDGQGKTLKTEEVASGTAATAPADPTRDGYTFKGWDKDFSNVTEDMTVTALWEKNADPTPAPAPSGESAPAPESAVILINTKTVNANAMNVAAVQSGASFNSATVVVLGKNVKKISKGSFKNFRNVKTLVVQSKKLKKSSVKKSLKGSAVKNVKVQVGNKKTNKKYVKKYKKIFTKKNCGRKVRVTR